MSISEMCKFVSFNSLSLYMGERENDISYVYETYMLSIFVRAPIPIAFSVQTPAHEILNPLRLLSLLNSSNYDPHPMVCVIP